MIFLMLSYWNEILLIEVKYNSLSPDTLNLTPKVPHKAREKINESIKDNNTIEINNEIIKRH